MVSSTVAGAHAVVDKAKQYGSSRAPTWVSRELVPFWKIQQLEVAETVPQDQRGLPQDVAQFEVVLLKTSGRRLSVGAVTVPRSLATDGLDRARQVAEAIGGMAGKPVQVARPRRRRRRGAGANHIPSGRQP
jgi:hypothetical protein